jgi:hypothetical protein
MVPGGYARAGSITYTGAGSDSDGPVSASITFTAISGGIEITITNDESGTLAKGQAVSGLLFTAGGGLSTPSAFTEISGNKVDSASFTPGAAFPGSSPVTPFSDSGSGSIDHWGFSTSGSSVTLESAGSGAPPKNPIYMILPSSGTTGPGSSLADGHFDPYILGPGQFFLTVAGVTGATNLTSADFSGVKIGFGTGPDTTVTATAVPEPSAIALVGAGVVGLARIGRRRMTP